MTAHPHKDVVALVADRNAEFTLLGLLGRHASMGIRAWTADIFTHPEKDPGCLLRGHDFLRPFQHRYRHALVLFDKEGCGREHVSRAELEHEVEERLHRSGWRDGAAAVVVEPELEAWVWASSPQVAATLGWVGKAPCLSGWLTEQGFATNELGKPSRPKEALEKALRELRKPRSSALYRALASCVSLDGCTDPAFLQLRRALTAWFGPGAA